MIQNYDMEDKVLIGSFIDGVLEEFRKECPTVATSSGIDETKIVYGNSLLIFPNGQSNGERINQGGLVEGSAFKITFLDDYERPAQDFEL